WNTTADDGVSTSLAGERRRHGWSPQASQTGDPGEALRLFRELLHDQQQVIGHDHPDTLDTRNNIASLTLETGEPQDALRLYCELLLDYERVLDSDHPDMLNTRDNIAFIVSKRAEHSVGGCGVSDLD
ncbi:MAG: tetratricopeptide repeat protein, partial [Fuerstiella sp.]